MGWEQDEKDGIRVPFKEGWIIPEKKQYWFMKRSAADVEVQYEGGDDYFTFTPLLGDFKDVNNLEKYLEEEYIKKKKSGWCDVNIEWLQFCHYEINPETIKETRELGDFVDSAGSEGDYLEWNKETQEFEDREDEEEEDDDEE